MFYGAKIRQQSETCKKKDNDRFMAKYLNFTKLRPNLSCRFDGQIRKIDNLIKTYWQLCSSLSKQVLTFIQFYSSIYKKIGGLCQNPP